MPRLNGPLFSLGAAGQLGKSVVYSSWKGRAYGRKFVVPTNPNDLDQRFQRQMLAALTGWWQYLKTQPALINDWLEIAAAENFSTFNAFIKTNLHRETLDRVPIGGPSLTGPNQAGNVNEVHLLGGVNEITADFQWDLTPDTSDLTLLILATNGGGIPSAQTFQRVLAHVANQGNNDPFQRRFGQIPAGSYEATAITIGPNGSTSGFIDSTAPAIVTGSP